MRWSSPPQMLRPAARHARSGNTGSIVSGMAGSVARGIADDIIGGAEKLFSLIDRVLRSHPGRGI